MHSKFTLNLFCGVNHFMHVCVVEGVRVWAWLHQLGDWKSLWVITFSVGVSPGVCHFTACAALVLQFIFFFSPSSACSACHPIALRNQTSLSEAKEPADDVKISQTATEIHCYTVIWHRRNREKMTQNVFFKLWKDYDWQPTVCSIKNASEMWD